MKKKQLIIFAVLLSTANLLFGQEDYKLTFTTDKKVGDEIRVSIHADAVIRPQIWIDLNNNGIRDTGEDIKTFDQWRDGNTPTYTLGSQTVTIYGRISQFGAEGGELTSIDFSKASGMVRVWLADNKLEKLEARDLTSQTGSNFHLLRLSGNKLKGTLDLSHLPISELRLERNNLESVKIMEHPNMSYLNVSRNFLTEESISNLLDDLGTRVGYSAANLYIVDTSDSFPEYVEGNRVKQYHLTHPNLNWGSNVGMNWFIRDIKSNTVLNDISTITDIYNMSLTTNKSVGSMITLSINAEEVDQPGIWIDLNGNTTKDTGEQVTTFGSSTTYTIASQNIKIYGPVTEIVASSNQLSLFSSTRNSFLTSLDIADNHLTKIEISPYQQLENLNIAINNFTAEEINNVVKSLFNRSSMSPGSLILIDYNLEEGEDGNILKAEHIMMASAKNWVVKDATGRPLLPTDIENIFNWLEMPSITVVGNYAILIGTDEDIAHFTKFYVNDQPVEPVFGRIDITEYTGNIELKVTNDDGSQMIRLVISK